MSDITTRFGCVAILHQDIKPCIKINSILFCQVIFHWAKELDPPMHLLNYFPLRGSHKEIFNERARTIGKTLNKLMGKFNRRV